MDRELIAYLDERFREVNEQLGALREDTAQQFAAVREDTAQQFAAVREEMAQQLGAVREEMAQQFAGVREDMNERLELVNGSVHENRILLEDMRGELRLVAEGVLGVDEKLESFRRPSEERSEEILSILRRLPPYAVLDGRVAALEDWKGRQGRDPIEVIRERYGPKATP